MSAPPNNPLKLPFFLLCGLIGVAMGAVAVANSVWWLLAVSIALVLGSAACARVVKQGRNPRWLRSPLDRRWPR